MQQLVVLGATGTIGRNTLDVVRRNPDRLHVLGLSAHRDADGLFELCIEFRPARAALADPTAAQQLRSRLRSVGAVGLLPTLAAVRAGKRVLIANKEPLVMAGHLLMAEAQAHGATLIPIDSEHNAIFQCLPPGSRCGIAPAGVRRVILTASGGPFRETPLAALDTVTPEQAVRHPNKGLELIEAAVLYALPEGQIDVVVHPQSTVHSLVEYVDGSTLAQLGESDMRVPIAHALAWPERWSSGVGGLDLAALGNLRFEAPDLRRFPCLGLARQALRAGGAAPNVLNAANEIAVEAFLRGQLRYTAIATVIERTLEAASRDSLSGVADLDAILAVDGWSRARAGELLHA
jgi:1-deoxy-D-xylulose-5-phosphate reductoisomerase